MERQAEFWKKRFGENQDFDQAAADKLVTMIIQQISKDFKAEDIL